MAAQSPAHARGGNAVVRPRGVDTTLDDIAAPAGVGVGSAHRRYPNQDALLDELFEERIAELGIFAEASLSSPDAWDARPISFLEPTRELFAAPPRRGGQPARPSPPLGKICR